MEFFCTTCCRDKRRDLGELPAIDRYVSGRIAAVAERAVREELPMLILSGEYGLLEPEDPIPWYDHALELDEVDALVPLLVEQLEARGVDRLRFVARPRETPGWEPYYQAIERACLLADVGFAVIPFQF